MDCANVPTSPHLTFTEFQELQRLFNDVAGLRIDDTALLSFERRLSSRLAALGLTSFKEYVRLVQFGPDSDAEIHKALDLLTTGETYFFRHDEQLRVLSDQILPALRESNLSSRRLTVWSAGCSSGEEAYTVAILLHDSELFEGWNVRVLGSDLSRERIEQARQARYGQGAFRTTAERLRQRYFQQVGRLWQVDDEIRRYCQFAALNLLGSEIDTFVGRVDVILCRNVLIYLDDRARGQVLQSLYERLMPGGYLLLGHSESLKFVEPPLDFTGLSHDLAFQKRGPRARRGNDT
jgi:chemotaxis protein methyltransferase CheR